MRVDLFLKLMGITKTRMVAKRLCDNGKVAQAGKILKPSHELEGGVILDVCLPQKEIRITVLEMPPTRSVSKIQRQLYSQIETLREI